MSINPVATWVDPDFETQSGTTYKTNLDNVIIVGKRITDAFAPHAKTTPDMNVLVDAGYVFVNQVLTEKTQQTMGPFTAPVSNPRIDRIVIDGNSGTTSILAGSEAVSPSPPDIPEGKLPCCQVALVVSQTSITNADITDERLGGGRLGPEVLDKITSNTTVGNNAAETDLYAKSIGAGTLGTNNALRLSIQITDLDVDSSSSGVLRFKYGGTTLCSITIDNAGGAVTNGVGFIQFFLAADGATNAQVGTAMMVQNNAGLTVSGGVANGTAAVDSTAAQTLSVTMDWDTASAAKSITLAQAILEVLR